jgi:hypothetical protein
LAKENDQAKEPEVNDLHYLYVDRIRSSELRRKAREESIAARLSTAQRLERKSVQAASRADRLRASIH